MNGCRVTRLAVLLAVLVAVLPVGAPAWAHRFYSTLAQVDLRADGAVLEVALRVDDHNLEDALRLELGRDFVLGVDAVGERRVRDYVARHFRVADESGRKAEFAWVGWEWSPGFAWLYFELEVGPLAAERILTQTLFLELSERQVNLVNYRGIDRERGPAGRYTLKFDRSRRQQRLDTPREREKNREADEPIYPR